MTAVFHKIYVSSSTAIVKELNPFYDVYPVLCKNWLPVYCS